VKWEEELQVEAGKAVKNVLKAGILDHSFIGQLYEVTIQILKIWSSAVTQEWILVFDNLVNILTPNVLNKDCVELAIRLGDISQPLSSRIASAHLIGSLSRQVDKKEFVSKLIPKAKRLCQDFNWEARKAVCLNLEKMSKGLSKQECDEYFYDEIFELLDDEEVEVKVSAIG
jgi:hypothetical protein